MEPNSACRLTATDRATLKTLLDHTIDEPARTLLADKLDTAANAADFDAGEIATLDCRVVFRVNDSPAYTRTLVAEARSAAPRAELASTSPRGIALLGLAACESAPVPGTNGLEIVHLDAVLRRRGSAAATRETGVAQGATILRLERRSVIWPASLPDNDPGPSAA